MGSVRCLLMSLFVAASVVAVTQAYLLAVDVNHDLVAWPYTPIHRIRYPYINVDIGTPPQTLKMALDLGWADIAVVNRATSDCGSNPSAPSSCSWGTYNQNASTTSQIQRGLNLTNGATSAGDGFVVKDLVKVGNTSFSNMTVTVRSDMPSVGIFGIGGYQNEERVTSQYQNVPITLNSNGNTSILGFSMYFQHSNVSQPGRLVFGGVEPTKFTGVLETLSIPPNTDSTSYGNITTTLSAVSVSGYSSRTPLNVTNVRTMFSLPDPGMGLPILALQQLLALLNLTEAQAITNATGFAQDYSGVVYPYNVVRNETTIDLNFGNTTIHVPIWDMALPYNATHGFLSLYQTTEYYRDRGEPDTVILGSSFFSNAYSVFDFSHNLLSIAPLNFDALSDDNIVPISSSGVAGLTGYEPSSTSQPGLSTGAEAGIGAGVGIGALLLVALLVYIFWWRRRSRKTNDKDTTNQTHGDNKSLVHPNKYEEKTERPPGTWETGSDSLSPTMAAPRYKSIRYSPVEMEGSSAPAAPSRNRVTANLKVKRKPLAPQELP